MNRTRVIFPALTAALIDNKLLVNGLLILASLILIAACGNGQSDKSLGGDQIGDVPEGLSDRCLTSTEQEKLIVDGAATGGSVGDFECALYTFTGSPTVDYTVTLTPSSGDPDLWVADDDGFTNILASSSLAASSTDFVTFTAPAEQTYYLAVEGFSASDYGLRVSIENMLVTGTTDQEIDLEGSIWVRCQGHADGWSDLFTATFSGNEWENTIERFLDDTTCSGIAGETKTFSGNIYMVGAQTSTTWSGGEAPAGLAEAVSATRTDGSYEDDEIDPIFVKNILFIDDSVSPIRLYLGDTDGDAPIDADGYPTTLQTGYSERQESEETL